MPTFLARTVRECRSGKHHWLRPFCNLGDEALANYEAIGVERHIAKGEVLFREDGPSKSVYVVCSGQVKLFCSSKDGKTLILRIAVAGDILGLGAVISGAAYEVTAMTTQPAQVKEIRRHEFRSFLENHVEGSLHAALALSDDYKGAFFDARRMALSGSTAGRLAGILLEWGNSAALTGKLEMRFTMALTHEDLANMAGTTRETVGRTLTQFRKDELIQVKGSSILILSPGRLEHLCA